MTTEAELVFDSPAFHQRFRQARRFVGLTLGSFLLTGVLGLVLAYQGWGWLGLGAVLLSGGLTLGSFWLLRLMECRYRSLCWQLGIPPKTH